MTSWTAIGGGSVLNGQGGQDVCLFGDIVSSCESVPPFKSLALPS